MMRRTLLAALVLLCSCAPRQESLQDIGRRVFDLAQIQLADMDKALAPGQCPRSYEEGELITSDIGWWCSGFYPGCLWLTYEYSGSGAVRELAVKHTLPLEGLLERHTDHAW